MMVRTWFIPVSLLATAASATALCEVMRPAAAWAIMVLFWSVVAALVTTPKGGEVPRRKQNEFE